MSTDDLSGKIADDLCKPLQDHQSDLFRVAGEAAGKLAQNHTEQITNLEIRVQRAEKTLTSFVDGFPKVMESVSSEILEDLGKKVENVSRLDITRLGRVESPVIQSNAITKKPFYSDDSDDSLSPLPLTSTLKIDEVGGYKSVYVPDKEMGKSLFRYYQHIKSSNDVSSGLEGTDI